MSKFVEMLRATATADKAKALLSLELLESKAVGIGDHSTGDFYNNAEEALQMLIDADDRLATLAKYYGNPLDSNYIDSNYITTNTSNRGPIHG